MKAKAAARKALSQRLRETLPEGIAGQFVGGTHTRRFEDNLVPTLTVGQARNLREQLDRSAGGELQLKGSGKRRAHAPYSSAAFAANMFGYWLGRESELSLAGVRGFSKPLQVERKQKIAHGGGTANFDAFLESDLAVVAVECKLTEALGTGDTKDWPAPYHRAEMREQLDGGWRDVLDASLAGDLTAHHVGVQQLLKHALALRSLEAGRPRHLVYLYWEPEDGDDWPEVVAHRQEVTALLQLVRYDIPWLHAMTFAKVLEVWGPRAPAHVAALRQRYALRLSGP